MTDKNAIAHVHRFKDKAGVYLGGGSTVYLDTDQIAELATALIGCLNDIGQRKFTESTFTSVIVESKEHNETR